MPSNFKAVEKDGEVVDMSDGYHTFTELYDHRIALFIALSRFFIQGKTFNDARNVWKSRKHFDGSEYEGWFIMGIGKERGAQISYHLPMSKWDAVGFAEELDRAPEWDGHTSSDVVERLNRL
jgi:hypothetical protein